jgi:hypothetical protein
LSKLTFPACGRVYDSHRRGSEEDAVTIDTTMTEADFSGKKPGATGAQILAAFMSTKLFKAKGALSSLDISGNGLNYCGRGMQELAPALAQNTTLTSLNVAYNNLLDMNGGIEALRNAIADMGSLSKLTFNDGGDWSTPVTFEIGMTEVDFSRTGMGTGGAIILAAWLEHKV